MTATAELVVVREPEIVVVEVERESILLVETTDVEVVQVGIAGAQGAVGLLETDEDGNPVVTPTGRLDFVGPGLSVVSGPGATAEISLDLSEVAAGGELEGTLDAPTVADLHSGTTHQSIIDTEHAHEIDNVGAHAASAISAEPFGTIASADVQSQLEEIAGAVGVHPGLSVHDALGLATDAELATGVSAAESYADGAVGVHAAAADPHPVYETAAEVQALVDAHAADASDAHDASAVSVVPFGTIAATDVQAALEEVAAEAGATGHPNLAAHDALGLATDSELATGVAAAETYADSAVSTHAGASDPHPGYLTAAEGNAAYDALGAAAAAISTAEGYSDAADAAHVAASDPHSQYETAAEAQALVDVHTADSSAAHAASAVAFTPDGIVSTNVQDAIEELAASAGIATGPRRLISFIWDGTNWVEESRT